MSGKFQRILVAFDGSKDSVRAVQLSASLASRFDSALLVVHVFSSPSVGLSAASGMPLPDYTDMEEASKEAGQKVLARGVETASESGAKAEGKLIEAPSVVEAIIEFAEKQNVDLIVVGTRGMTGFKKLILGSVSSGLVGHAHCPVMVVR